MGNTLEHLAAELADAGIAAFPVMLNKTPIARGMPGGSWKKWVQRLRCGPSAAATIFLLPPDGSASGLAAVLGRVSGGLIAVDFDTDKSADPDPDFAPKNLAAWAAAHPDLARRAWIVSTGGGGYHVLVRVRVLPRFGSKTWHRGGKVAGEVRADGTYVVAAGSLHESGRRYVTYAGSAAAIPLVGTLDDAFCPQFAVLGGTCGTRANRAGPGSRPGERAADPRDGSERPGRPRGTPAVPDSLAAAPGSADEAVHELRAAAGRKFAAAYAAILKTIPRTAGVRHAKLFRLRCALAQLLGADDLAHPVMIAAFKAWYAMAAEAEVMRTRDYGANAKDWLGTGPARDPDYAPFMAAVRAAAEAAKAGGDESPVNVARTVTKAAFRTTGGFFLSVRTLASAAGMSEWKARTAITALVEIGELVRVEGDRGPRMAATFTWADPVAAGLRSPDSTPVTPGELPGKEVHPAGGAEADVCVWPCTPEGPAVIARGHWAAAPRGSPARVGTAA